MQVVKRVMRAMSASRDQDMLDDHFGVYVSSAFCSD